MNECKKFNEEYDAIVHLNDQWEIDTIEKETIFENYTQAFNYSVKRAVLASHLASHLLAPNGIVIFTASKSSFDSIDLEKFAEDLADSQIL